MSVNSDAVQLRAEIAGLIRYYLWDLDDAWKVRDEPTTYNTEYVTLLDVVEKLEELVPDWQHYPNHTDVGIERKEQA